MGTRLAPDGLRRIVALAAALAVLSSPLPFIPVLVIAVFAAVGAALPAAPAPRREATRVPGSAMVALAVFGALLIGLPLLAAATHAGAADIAARFYRTGALVFGGGHVVLPLLQNELVRPGLIDRDLFLAGYGAAQAVPGPLFSFAFYAGAMLSAPPNGWLGGLLALGAIYLPSFLLVFGALPWWDRLKTLPRARRALDLANAAVVGLLLAALYTPVFTSAVGDWLDLGLAGLGLMALLLELPPVLVVVVLGAVGALFAVL
jgi:chromate transporter